MPALTALVHTVQASVRTSSDAALLPHLSVGGARWWKEVHAQLHLSPEQHESAAETEPSLSLVAAYGDDNIEILTMNARDTGIVTESGTTSSSILFRFVRLHITDIASGNALQRSCPNCGAPCALTADARKCPYCGFDLVESAGTWKLDCMYSMLIMPVELP